jgi:hypothetical protein
MNDLDALRGKLTRELAQSEQSARVHPVREARRLGDVPPAMALLALSDHAVAMSSRLDSLMRRRGQRTGLRLGHAVGRLFSALRHGLFDRLIGAERSYRGTLLGFHHGLDVARLLREVAHRTGDLPLATFCDDLLGQRTALLERAEQSLAWFADHPRHALAHP